jgi:hypothetical protein
MVEMYKHVNNVIINSYWEARLPRNFEKPGQNATANEVEAFIRDKYINKKWVDTGVKMDLASMYWNDRKKFEKYKLKLLSGDKDEDDDEEESEDEEERKRRKKERKEKRKEKKAD